MIAIRILALLALATPAAADPLPLNPAVTAETLTTTICRPHWSREQRPARGVTRAVKRARLREIGRDANAATQFALDHRIPLDLGGARLDAANLALQPIGEARAKDRVETCLARAVCAGRIDLSTAQAAIWQDWRAAKALCRRKGP